MALLSCPSLYKPVKNAVECLDVIVRLFEFDRRFTLFGADFVFYDYKNTANLYEDMLYKDYDKYFDIVLADPPFLSQECIEQMSVFIKRVAKDDANLLICSGETVHFWIKHTLNLEKCEFQPEHERNLANEFCTFANFDLDSLLK